jgi:hypothetical protein
MAKYGNRLDTAIKKHAHDETKFGLQRLPPGIIGGVARLVECGVFPSDNDKYKGEYYFRAAGVIISPASVAYKGNSVAIEGRQTSVVEMICDTVDSNGKRKTMEEHAVVVLNELRKLGASPDSLAEGLGALESICAELKEAAPYFNFSTSEGKKTIDPKTKEPREPMVFENWHGTRGLENYVPAATNGVDDRTGAESHPPTGDDPEPSETEETVDLQALLADATGDNVNDSQAKLEEMAIAAGKTQDEVNNAKSWEEVVGWIEGTGAEAPADEPDKPDEPYEPSKGDLVKIEVLKDSKNPKKGSKIIEVEVLTVNKKGKTVTVKNLETGKPVMDSTGKKAKEIEWDSLIIE